MKKPVFLLILFFMTMRQSVIAAPDDELTVVAGVYNEPGQPGLFSFRFNQESGLVTPLDTFETRNASYIAFNPARKKLYTISELGVDDSGVSSFNFNPADGLFSLAKTADIKGSPCYISVNDNFAVTANYGGGTISLLALDDDFNPVSNKENAFAGTVGGNDSVRQNLPHVHCTVFSPDGKRLFVTDFSSDRIVCLDIDEKHRLIQARDVDGNPLAVNVASGTGPRHLIFDNEGKHAYLIGELSGEITVFDVDGDNNLVAKQTILADPVRERASADIHLSPDGRFLYASNRRRNDGIAIFAVDSQNSTLSPVGYRNTGLHPRNFVLSPNGKYVLVACRDTNAIEIYRRDSQSGLITDLVNTIGLTRPVCVIFAQ